MNSKSKISNTYSISEVAKKLKVSSQQINEMCKYGKIPEAFQIYPNGPWRIPYYSLKNEINIKITIFDKFKYLIKKYKFFTIISFISSIFLFFFSLISASADFYGAKNFLTNAGIIRAFEKQQEGETLVVISEYYNFEGTPDHNIQSYLKKYIEEQSLDLDINNLRVEIIPKKIQISDESIIQRIAKRYKASIVIAGEYTEIEIKTYILINNEVANFSYQFYDIENSYLTSPSDYKNYITMDLPSYISFFSTIINSYIYCINDLSEESIELFENILKYFDTTKTNSSNLSLLYLSLARYYYSGYFVSESDIFLDSAIDADFLDQGKGIHISIALNEIPLENRLEAIKYIKGALAIGIPDKKHQKEADFILGMFKGTLGEGVECYAYLSNSYIKEDSLSNCMQILHSTGFIKESIELPNALELNKSDEDIYCRYTFYSVYKYWIQSKTTLERLKELRANKPYDILERKKIEEEFSYNLFSLNYSDQYRCEFGNDLEEIYRKDLLSFNEYYTKYIFK